MHVASECLPCRPSWARVERLLLPPGAQGFLGQRHPRPRHPGDAGNAPANSRVPSYIRVMGHQVSGRQPFGPQTHWRPCSELWLGFRKTLAVERVPCGLPPHRCSAPLPIRPYLLALLRFLCLPPFPPSPSQPTPGRNSLGSGTTLSAAVLSALSLRQHHPEGEAAGHGGAQGSAGHGPVPAEPQRHRAHHPAAEGGRRCSPGRWSAVAAAAGKPVR